MANLATALKSEVTRLARKELRTENEALKKAVSAHRTELVSVKRRLTDLEKLVKQLSKVSGKAKAVAAAEANEAAGEAGHRFSAKGLATNRARLGLSAADYGLLVGTTGQSIYQWESGKAKPRARALPAIAELRRVGKKEVAERLAALKG